VVYELPALPYADNALEPYISAKTLKMHHGMQRRYVERLNGLVRGTSCGLPLEELIMSAKEDTEILDCAQQVFNHTFLWHSMCKEGGGMPSVRTGLGQAIRRFGNVFQRGFVATAQNIFGSGYVWLVADPRGEVFLWAGKDADNPMCYGLRPLLTLDVWEHSYLLDYGPQREKYAQDFLKHLVNWPFAEANYARAFGA
jgi:Fe-Mn family superoxide dismutase